MKNYGGWLFMYGIIAMASAAAFIVMFASCDFFKLALWAKCILFGVLGIGCFCIHCAWNLTHKGS